MRRSEFQDGIMVCDDTGCVIISPNAEPSLQEVTDKEIKWRQQLEKGMSTFDITCN